MPIALFAGFFPQVLAVTICKYLRVEQQEFSANHFGMPGAFWHMMGFEARLSFDGLVRARGDRDLGAKDKRIGSGLGWF